MGNESENMLARALRDAVRQVASEKAATGTAGYYGTGGSTPALQAYGLNQNWYNAMSLPLQGLIPKIPWRPSRFATEKYALLTGVSAVTGVQSSDECGEAPVSGTVSFGSTTNPFGRFKLQTPSFDVSRFMEVRDRSTFQDYSLNGDPFAEAPVTIDAPADTASMLKREIAKIFFEFKVGWLRTFNPVIAYTGNPTNNIGNGYAEPRGLDLLINTGYVNVENSALMPEADSLVRSFGGFNIGTTTSTTVNGVAYTNASAAAVAECVAIYRTLMLRAEKTGLAPAKIAMLMTRTLFYELTASWACNYLTARCTPQNGSLTLDSGDQIALRDQMRNGDYLLIDGEKVPVIVDNEIAFSGTTELTSTIYFVPLQILGSQPGLWGEFFDQGQPGGAIEASNLLGNMGDMSVTGAGRFLWTRERSRTCVYWTAQERSRLVLPTPFLAARLTNIKYTPLIVEN